jgi:hypothetical protein
MSRDNLSKETETRLIDFFTNNINPKDIAKAIRQVNYVLALGALRECETVQSEIKNLENSFYCMNKLAEVLDPIWRLSENEVGFTYCLLFEERGITKEIPQRKVSIFVDLSMRFLVRNDKYLGFFVFSEKRYKVFLIIFQFVCQFSLF